MRTFFNLILYFTIYSFIGWLCESLYCWFCNRKFTNRGFLNGPFCPIYGFGALILIIALSGIDTNYFLVFILGMLLTSTLEYITSYVMEKIFNARWWDYSNQKFNIHGRVCLVNSILFGLMSVVFISFIHQPIEDFVNSIPYNVIRVISIILAVYFIFDFCITVISISKFNNKLKKVNALSKLVVCKTEGISNNTMDELKKKLDSLLGTHRTSHIRILKAFPKMKSIRYSETLEKIKVNLFKQYDNEK